MAGAAIIVAHGSPSDPPRQEAAMAALARQVSERLSGWEVASATLADKDALGRAFRSLPANSHPLIYPMFMSDGWFVSDLLPRRVAKAGGPARQLAPLGLDPDLPASAAAWLSASHDSRAAPLSETTLVVAAHGAPKDPRAGRAARTAAKAIAALARPAACRVCFVDQAPYLVEGLDVDGSAVCLPFFATAASHVEEDLPDAIAEAGFAGQVLPPLGLAPFVPCLIARRLRSAATVSA